MTARSRELAIDLARRAIAAAERRRAAEAGGAEVADRLRDAADEDGRLSVDDALGAVAGEPRKPWNPFTDEGYQARQAAKRRRDHERLFGPEPEPTEPSTTPQGDVDAGKGEPDDAEYETVWTDDGPQRMRVFPLD